MKYAQSLRSIGQLLEVAKVSVFALDGDGRNYSLQSYSMSRTAEWMLRYVAGENDLPSAADRRAAAREAKSRAARSVPFSDTVIAQLDARGAKRRHAGDLAPEQTAGALSDLLRTLGDHLDRGSARTFHLYWMADAIVLDFQRSDGSTDRQRFTPEKLVEVRNSSLRRFSGERRKR